MPEERRQRLQGYAGVDQGGGVGMAKLVRGDVFEPGGAGGAVQFDPDRALREPSVVGDQELGQAAVAGVRQRPPR